MKNDTIGEKREVGTKQSVLCHTFVYLFMNSVMPIVKIIVSHGGLPLRCHYMDSLLSGKNAFKYKPINISPSRFDFTGSGSLNK